MDTAALTNRSSTCSPNALSLYTNLSGENKASEGAVPDVLEGSHPWVSGQTAARELKYLGANRFLPFVVRHSFHCRMYVCVCVHVILMYVMLWLDTTT